MQPCRFELPSFAGVPSWKSLGVRSYKALRKSSSLRTVFSSEVSQPSASFHVNHSLQSIARYRVFFLSGNVQCGIRASPICSYPAIGYAFQHAVPVSPAAHDQRDWLVVRNAGRSTPSTPGRARRQSMRAHLMRRLRSPESGGWPGRRFISADTSGNHCVLPPRTCGHDHCRHVCNHGPVGSRRRLSMSAWAENVDP